MIRKIISSKIEDNQLSEADLTFKEIEIIIQTFIKSLISIHHKNKISRSKIIKDIRRKEYGFICRYISRNRRIY